MAVQSALSAFFEESDAHIEIIETSLLALEKKNDDPELIDELFRATHSIKGNAGLVGFIEIHAVSTEMEHILDELRTAKKPVEQKQRDELFEYVDKIKGLIERERGPTPGGSIKADEVDEPAPKKETKASDRNRKKPAEKPEKKQTVKKKLVFLTFALGTEEYGLEISYISEIILNREITRVPNAKSFVKGIMNLRGTVVPIIDVKAKLGFQHDNGDVPKNIIILEHDGFSTGVLVDVVKDIVTIDEKNIVSVERSLGRANSEFLMGIGTTDKNSILLLDMEHFCSQTEKYY